LSALHIALKDVRLLFADRSGPITALLLPMVFIVVLTGAMQGWMGPSPDLPQTLHLVDGDGTAASREYVASLGQAGGVYVVALSEGDATAGLRAGVLHNALVIPQGFGEAVAAGRPVSLRLLTHPDASPTTTDALYRVAGGVARGMPLVAGLTAGLGESQSPAAPAEQAVLAPEEIAAQAREQIARARSDPRIAVEQVRPTHVGEAAATPTAAQQNIPGYTIISVFLTAQATAQSIHREKREGSFRRLLAAPMERGTLLAGKMLGNAMICLLQVGAILVASLLLLPALGMERLSLGPDPGALALVTLLMVACSTGLGVLIAAVARTEGQIGGLGSLVLWTAGALGGCLFPPFLLGGLLDTLGSVVPHYWAIRAYQGFIVRGQTLSGVLPEMLALGVFAILFFGVGLWRLRYD
jgi:ABC-2 type transport system permease protein